MTPFGFTTNGIYALESPLVDSEVLPGIDYDDQ